MVPLSSRKSEKSKQRSPISLNTPLTLPPPPPPHPHSVNPSLRVDNIDKRIDQRGKLRQRVRDEVLAEIKASGQFENPDIRSQQVLTRQSLHLGEIKTIQRIIF